MEIAPVTLEGQHVRLEPLSPAHEESLIAAARDGELWKSTVTIVPSRATMAAYIASALDAQALGRELPFVIKGVLRNHMVMPSGRYRDSVCFSIIEAEWPEVKARLEAKLGQEAEDDAWQAGLP